MTPLKFTLVSVSHLQVYSLPGGCRDESNISTGVNQIHVFICLSTLPQNKNLKCLKTKDRSDILCVFDIVALSWERLERGEVEVSRLWCSDQQLLLSYHSHSQPERPENKHSAGISSQASHHLTWLHLSLLNTSHLPRSTSGVRVVQSQRCSQSTPDWCAPLAPPCICLTWSSFSPSPWLEAAQEGSPQSWSREVPRGASASEWTLTSYLPSLRDGQTSLRSFLSILSIL